MSALWSCSLVIVWMPSAGAMSPPGELASLHLADCLQPSHSRAMDEATAKSILAVIERLAEWIRHDLAAKDAAIRTRAEETVAAMIATVLGGTSDPPS